MAQPSAPKSEEEVPIVRLLADGTCQIQDIAIPCAQICSYLLSKFPNSGGHVHLEVNLDLRYERVAAVLETLRNAGCIKVGFVNNAP